MHEPTCSRKDSDFLHVGILVLLKLFIAGTYRCNDGGLFTAQLVPDTSWTLNPDWTEDNAEEEWKYIRESGNSDGDEGDPFLHDSDDEGDQNEEPMEVTDKCAHCGRRRRSPIVSPPTASVTMSQVCMPLDSSETEVLPTTGLEIESTCGAGTPVTPN